ncbi:MAG: D-tyrosyl-tRNA(Tyr) deacylase [Deltaproteobacteria bacterium]|nr:D-tyrosyl-tRNA(Tyr) deacylase [Deltaproteobacteria bacterium]MBW2398024.1 D-tyrosyl-tRNA(Tyr) deacylase [Deltaproteobacteria bacterium]MBW2665533.1 D-tyrosyl-tRNA(Tyr) deacylase [Deltaproteobacteria bacterium]
MRAVAQRVSSAEVRVDGERISEMGEGLLAFVGVGREDDARQADELARRLVRLRIFNDDAGRMNHSLLDVGGTLGVVSQFTLFGDARQGRRPFFGDAAPADQAAPLIERLIASAELLGARTARGRFQATMEVELVNVGPVTLLLDTDKRF